HVHGANGHYRLPIACRKQRTIAATRNADPTVRRRVRGLGWLTQCALESPREQNDEYLGQRHRLDSSACRLQRPFGDHSVTDCCPLKMAAFSLPSTCSVPSAPL